MGALSDDEIVFFEKMNMLKVRTQTNGRGEMRLLLSHGEFQSVCELEKIEPTLKEKEKTRIALIRQFLEEHHINTEDSIEHFEKTGLMCDRDFISFVRKPERIHRDQMKYHNRVMMSIDDKMFTAEDRDILRAVHKCCKLVYPSFLKYRNTVIPRWKKLFSSLPSDDDKMKMCLVADDATLRKAKAYIEPSDVLLIDLEGDQLGPNGEITLMQVNTYENNICFLIDIKILGDFELSSKNGWLRKLFESQTKMKVMWGGCSDASNLWASYHIKVNCMVDLQVLEFANRKELIKNAPAIIDYSAARKNPPQAINLELAYKSYTDSSLLHCKANQAQHKKDYHIWAQRPLSDDLLKYAAFDVASLRPLTAVFFKALQLWRWGSFEAATCRSRITCEPRVRTCFTCLRTMFISKFAKNQHKQISNCRECMDGYFVQIEDEKVSSFNDYVGTGYDILDTDPKILLNEVTNELNNATLNMPHGANG